MKKSVFQKVLFILGFACLGSHSADALSTNFIKRLGQSCTGVCDQASSVCEDKKTLSWCKKNCGHKIKMEEVCKTKGVLPAQAACSHAAQSEIQIHATAAVAAKNAYTYGIKGGTSGPDFKEIKHLQSKSTDLVAWSGVKDCILYVAFRGTKNLRDVVKDVQIGVAHLAGKVGLSGFASRGEYNNVVNRAIKFYHDSVKAADGQFSYIVITGHSLGGGIAMNVGDRVARGQKNVEVVTHNAPGTDFMTNKAGDGHKNVNTTHYRSQGDIVSKFGKTTKGQAVTMETQYGNARQAHRMSNLVKELDETAKKHHSQE